IEKNNKIAIVLPGPPHEMKHIYGTQVKPYLLKKSEEVIFYKVLRFFGIGESALEAEIEDLITYQTDPTLAPYAKKGGVSLRIASKKRSLTEAEKAVDEMIDKVKGKLDRYLYSVDNEELVDVVARKLIERNISIATAESCTGGGLASALTDIPGISQVFHSGYVTYSNEAKMDTLGVKEETLHTYGAVSEETAVEMAEGLFKKTKSDLCIAITGIAGPGGGTATKPVGLTYIALKYKDKTICKEYKLAFQSREQNRNYSILLMLHLINKNI
ncbi:MAG: nicotinamide-nucleotide amidohydrolase family protein, partial [Peptostreptococcales bacterium]